MNEKRYFLYFLIKVNTYVFDRQVTLVQYDEVSRIMKINKFIDRNVSRIGAFEEMVRKVSKETNLSRASISSIGETALQLWEETENQDPQRLIFQSKEERIGQIEIIISNFQQEISPMVDSAETIKKSVEIFQESLGKMFEI